MSGRGLPDRMDLPDARRRWSKRIRTLALAVIYVAGNFGVPSADLLLHSLSDASPPPVGVHFEGPVGCRQHADHCGLGRMLSALRLQSATAAASLSQTSATVVTHLRPAASHGGRPTLLGFNPRAPPAPLA